ncbi:MAG: TIM barrel protein [Tepidisphaeraceae bacterium]
MRKIGFSTGAVAMGDFRHALEVLAKLHVNAVELSALRFGELDPLLNALDDLPLTQYSYIAFHVPAKFTAESEPDLVRKLHPIKERGWPLIMHPDAMFDRRAWKSLSSALCFENMDKRKPLGRTAEELARIFGEFEDSSLCFDLGHASQIDRTMAEACLIIQQQKTRIRQIHISEVNTKSEHVAISAASELAFAKIVGDIGYDMPIIIESVVKEHQLLQELTLVTEIFANTLQEVLETD